MVEDKNDEFEELISKASVKARDFNFKKLVLKSLRMDVENKNIKENGPNDNCDQHFGWNCKLN